VRIYIIGFLDKKCFERFSLPPKEKKHLHLGDLLGIQSVVNNLPKLENDLFGLPVTTKQMSLSASNGINNYFLFNDIRNGETTIHSWDLVPTTDRQKEICLLILKQRRKKTYGCLDGNPLALCHLQSLDKKISQKDVDELIALEILAPEDYMFRLSNAHDELTDDESEIIALAKEGLLVLDELKANRKLKLKKVPLKEKLASLEKKGAISCVEVRYDFKNTKISTGLNGVNRVFLPSSLVFSTLVASDTNDMVATKDIHVKEVKDYRRQFIEEIYEKGNFRKITKSEACVLQGFPAEYRLPKSRARWMKLLGNSVSVPVIDKLCRAIIDTGAFSIDPNIKK
jgi:DNA (cytosine-5)-methyltransferase 1